MEDPVSERATGKEGHGLPYDDSTGPERIGGIRVSFQYDHFDPWLVTLFLSQQAWQGRARPHASRD